MKLNHLSIDQINDILQDEGYLLVPEISTDNRSCFSFNEKLQTYYVNSLTDYRFKGIFRVLISLTSKDIKIVSAPFSELKNISLLGEKKVWMFINIVKDIEKKIYSNYDAIQKTLRLRDQQETHVADRFCIIDRFLIDYDVNVPDKIRFTRFGNKQTEYYESVDDLLKVIVE